MTDKSPERHQRRVSFARGISEGSSKLSPSWNAEDRPEFIVTTSYRRWGARRYLWKPPTDMYEMDDTIVVRVEAAGMRQARFTISLEDRILAIHGVRPNPEERGAYHQMEIRFGEFLTVVELPGPVEVDEVEAEYVDGFLRVILPKKRPQNVRVKTEDEK